MNPCQIKEKYNEISAILLSKMNNDGYWTGRLSDSALSTAVAIVALKVAGDQADAFRIEKGFSWLLRNINANGGFGDTTASESNVSTTLLCYAAVSFCQREYNGAAALNAMAKWLSGEKIEIDPGSITTSLLRYYGNDYTFSVPILSMLHLCGVIPDTALKKIPYLPYEFTLLPSAWYRFVNLKVVSYALPALIAVGVYLQKVEGRLKLRNYFIKPAVRKLSSLVPESGGFLEAIPLTGFVAMCLHAGGENNNLIVKKGIEFLRNQQREEGGWPIDTDLSTWVTTLSIKALGSDAVKLLTTARENKLRSHLLGLQCRSKHPFNGAVPGGWGWTNYSGSVPDADDTPGAVLALLELYNNSKEEDAVIKNGCRWLIALQNSDGGFPTFCRGWGKLPFDSSCADLTGHSLLALLKTKSEITLDPELTVKLNKCVYKAVAYLKRNQSEDGSWVPLWFGNQLTGNKTNPVYGTAKVCTYLNDCITLGIELPDDISGLAGKARSFLLMQQNTDGSWGGKKGIPGSVEETSLAICALAGYNRDACTKGFEWLAGNRTFNPAPIGLYFALLWYDEELYPVIFYTEALRRFQESYQ